jgi:hypothetical protein
MSLRQVINGQEQNLLSFSKFGMIAALFLSALANILGVTYSV